MTIENISEEYAIVDFECPKCGEHIGSGQGNLIAQKEAVETEKEKFRYLDKIFELGAEGGSIAFYKDYDKKTASDWFYYDVSDMGFEEEDIPPSRRKSELSYTFWESLLRLKNEKPNFYNLHPSDLEEKFKDDIIALLRLCFSEDNIELNYEYCVKILNKKKKELIGFVERK